jgi:hypothetical protein
LGLEDADEAFLRWAADRLLDQLRRGSAPAGSAGIFAWEPMLSVLRASVAPDDRDLVAALLEDDERYMFGGLLSRAFLDDEALTALLVRRFRTEAELERAIGLLHQLAARSLEEDGRRELVTWLTANADAFVDEQRRFFGGVDGRRWMEHRLTHPDFAEKRWVYLFSALALDPTEDVDQILETHLAHPDPIVVEAARAAKAYAASHPPPR